VGVSIYNLSEEKTRQISLFDIYADAAETDFLTIDNLLEQLGQRYGLDFAGNLDKVFHGETLYRTIEYMRKKHFRR
jgi:DNA polymerase-4/DNA polymerase IV (DinB-like DNA polymerase)